MASSEANRPQRPRASSMLSIGSHKSKGSQGKIDLVESPREKMARRITGKADPSVAINELQPSARAQEQNTMAPLRSMQHRDSFGNVITDPDRSNPTRPRLERPLDTIRSFESAIDSSYTRRYSAAPDMQSRRSSYIQGSYGAYGSGPRTPGAPSTYFDRQPGSRPDSVYSELRDTRENDRGHQNAGNYYGHPQQRRYPPRSQSETVIYGQNGSAANSTPQWTHPHLAQQAQEAAGTNSASSYATDQGTDSTDASLHNPSYGELPQQQRMQMRPPPENYSNSSRYAGGDAPEDGYSHQSNAPRYDNRNHAPPQHNVDAPPPPPAHGRAQLNGGKTLRKPVRQDAPPPPPKHGSPAGVDPAERPSNDKRKSWLARRFSKNG